MTPPPPGPVHSADDAANAVLWTMFSKIVVLRVFLAPLLVAGVVTLTWLDPVTWRVVLAALLLSALVAGSLAEYVRWTRGLSGPNTVAANVVGMIWLQLGLILISGGLDSPLLPIVPATALQATIIFGPGTPLVLIVGGQLAMIWTLAVLDARGAGLAIPLLGGGQHGAQWPWVVAGFLTVMLFVALTIGTRARALIARIVSGTLEAHDRERTAHADHSRELAALSAEIAHELKNPLASIKGLAALLARDLEGRSAERLAVLRTEVDRMQETLQEFLDFSRPLVPLNVGPVDLAELGAEVASLCDGMAQGRGVRVTSAGSGSGAADRRKLRQVLVNLVQNAIEAAPAGTEVRVEAAPGRIDVLDRGPGLPAELAEVVFDAGVTTRERGSGLGLTIARALVQQHGGTLTLDPREGGGTRARVLLEAT